MVRTLAASRGIASGRTLEGVLPLAPELWAWWKMDEASGNLADSTGNGNTITEVGTVPSAAGKIGNARGPYSADNYFQFATTPIAGIGQPFTLLAWGKYTANATVQALIEQGQTDAGISGPLIRVTDDSKLRVANHTSGLILTGTTTIADGWHHFAVTSDGENLTGYLDGEIEVGPTFHSAITTDMHRLNIGRRVFNSAAIWNDLIDLCGVVTTRAWTLAEIRNLYRSGLGLDYPFSLLRGVAIGRQVA